RKAADRANQLAAQDPEAKTRRGEILAETADVQQLAKQYKDAAGTYAVILNEKLLPGRDEELSVSQITALHLAGDFAASDAAIQKFRDTFPRSTLTPAVLFRHAENAYFALLQADKIPDTAQRLRDVGRLLDETIKRYQVVVDKYPDFPQVNLARYGVGMA